MALQDYLETLRTRRKESRVYRPFQLHGLELGQLLGDEKHKALYIKLAKNYDPERLRALAAAVVENKNVKNKGAYFMAAFSADKENYERPHLSKRPARRRKVSAAKNKKV